jgi:hypothetical protein
MGEHELRPTETTPAAGELLIAVVAALPLVFGTSATWAQGAFVSVSGDYGDIGSPATETSGSTQEEPTAFLLAPPVAGEAVPFAFQDCPPPKIKANVVFGDATVAAPIGSVGLTARTIESRQNNGDAPDDPGSSFLVLGDYRPNLEFKVSYRLGFIRLLDGSFHACVRALNVSAAFKPVITIAREIPPGSCLEREVLAHERGHWAIDSETIPELGPQLEEAAAPAISPGFDGQTMAEVQSRVSAALQSSLDAFIGDFTAIRQARQAAHDSPEERERIDQACGQAASEVAARINRALPPRPVP